ncbi:hypothetical protein [Salinirubrum litoreum]|uniref:DUF8113 domain-containing protein n=1 Tax=Salinirubrum litoreum TaxID=1126234 RepID=A0ABD5R7X4_9EURY|nr:hypothetical protein [Salinirubrum litoreum]
MDDFERRLTAAKQLLADDVTAFHVGVVRENEEIDTAFGVRADDPQQESLQSLSLLATHVRLVAREAGVEPSTVAGDAAALAGEVADVEGALSHDPDEE